MKAYDSRLCICIGSSLLVKPAISFPLIVKKRGGKLVIINMDQTPMDEIADLTFNENCDIVMKALMETMQIDVPEYLKDQRYEAFNNVQ